MVLRTLAWAGAAAAVMAAAASSCGSSAPVADCPTQRYADAGDSSCAVGKGGPMRRVPLVDGGTMCIDETEVTVGAYQAFLTSGDKVELPTSDPAYARCAAKTTYAPSCETSCSGADCELPQDCVDQCDAKLYCQWAGKTLCGPIGAATLSIDDVNDPTKNQWMNACTAGGALTWPYGSTYESTACNTSDETPAPCGGPAVTSAYAKCQAPSGPYDGVFDLSGNLSEWVNASQEGADWPEQRCVIMGGSYVHYLGDVSCSGATLQWPCNSENPEFGFRCCGP